MCSPDTIDTPTPRQLLILSMCARGESREDIGRELFLSPRTVREDMDRAREAMGAKNITHAVSICLVTGLFRIDRSDINASPGFAAVA